MGKFYWLKMKNSFFDQHDVKIIERHTHGKEILLFYIKLLVESVDHEGELRFSDEVSYDENSIGLLTDTEPEIVHEAFTLLQSLKMMMIDDDGTICLKGVAKMIGSEEANDHAQRQKRYRERQKEQSSVTDNLTLASLDRHSCVTLASRNVTSVTNSDERLEIRDKSIENRDIERNIKERNSKFQKPTLSEISEYCNERQNNVNPEDFFSYYEANGWKVGKNSMKDWKAAVRYWESRSGSKKTVPSSNPFTELKKKEGYL